MSTIVVNFISLFWTYVTILKRKKCVLHLWYHYMLGRNIAKLKTNSALKAVYRVKHHLKWLKIKCRSSELQGLSCRNNIVTACCWSAGRTTGVCPAFVSSAHAAQGRCVARDCPVPSTGSHVIQSKRIWRWYNVVLARPTCCWRSSGVYIHAFICVQYFKHTWLPLVITLRTLAKK